MRWRSYLVGLSACVLMATVAVALALSTSTQTADAAEYTVNVRDFSFNPSTLTVQIGDVVRWSNGGAAPHTATSDTGTWDSGNISPGGVFSHQFLTAGTFSYFCRIHPNMRAAITVQAPPATAVPPTTAPTQAPPPPPPPTQPPAVVTVVVPPEPVPAPTPIVIVAPPRAPELWLQVYEVTPAFTLADELAWLAAPGEWYRILDQDGGWALAVWEFDLPSNVVWIELDGRVEVAAY